MYRIMHQNPGSASTEYTPGVRLTSSQYPTLDNYLSVKSPMPGKAVPLNSLNRQGECMLQCVSHGAKSTCFRPTLWTTVRQKEYKYVMEQNAHILRRLTTSKPTYSREKWQQERRETERYLQMLSRDNTVGHLRKYSKRKTQKPKLPSLNGNPPPMSPISLSKLEAFGRECDGNDKNTVQELSDFLRDVYTR